MAHGPAGPSIKSQWKRAEDNDPVEAHVAGTTLNLDLMYCGPARVTSRQLTQKFQVFTISG